MGLIQVGLALRLADRQRYGDLVGTGLDGVLGSAQVRHQGRNGQAGQGARVGDNLSSISKLRKQFRRHKRTNLDFRHACFCFGLDPGFLCFGRHDGLDTLQAVTRANFAYQDVDFTHC